MSQHDGLVLLIVDDESAIRESLSTFLRKLGHETLTAADADAALATARERNDIDLALLDIRLPGLGGFELFERLRGILPDLCVIMVSGHGTMDSAIEAMRLGAADFLRKPVELLDLEAAVERAGRFLRLEREERRLRGTIQALQRDDDATAAGPLDAIVGRSDATADVRHHLAVAAEARCANLLVTGPTGTGKEVVARAFHGLARDGPFIAVNCPALPASLVESELFGHVRGAFTGATDERIGAFELAQAGTLFLDEIADLPLDAQAKLLRVLETRTVRRVGGAREVDLDVTVVAASNRPLDALVAEQRFREDLYYRLNVFEIHLRDLRERPADILPLARHFVQAVSRRTGHAAAELAPGAEAALLEYDYPGNARELRNIIERALMLARGGTIQAEHLNLPSQDRTGSRLAEESQPIAKSDIAAVSDQARAAEREATATLDALESAGWNRRRAAEALGISYEALRWRIKKHGLAPR
ncbi:MAG: sigma-54-dependent transcriptional regulator [Planctomycetota bacterium]